MSATGRYLDELATHEPMTVRMVDTGSGTRPEPPLNPRWSKVDQLRWKAGILLDRTGISVRIATGCYSRRIFGREVVDRDAFGIDIGNSSHMAYSFDETWVFLTGVEAGAEAVR